MNRQEKFGTNYSLYQQQCLKISSLFTDNYFIPILTVERKLKFDCFLRILLNVDDYTRDRINHFAIGKGWTGQNWSHMHKDFNKPKNLKVNIPRFEYNKNDCWFKTKSQDPPINCRTIPNNAVPEWY